MSDAVTNPVRDVFFTKSRHIWQISAYRLLREGACTRYARQVVPPVMGGFHIIFPETEVSTGLRVSVKSRGIAGRPLLYLLYQPEMHGQALDLGMATLEALHGADVTTNPFVVFGTGYRFLKGPTVLLRETFGRSSFLSGAERRELRRLVWRFVMVPERRKVLVHGDLQPSHLLVDLVTSTLGIIDLEALHLGKPASNFGHLFTGYHYADATLGYDLYWRYRERFPALFDHQFDDDLRAVVALRSYRHICVARSRGNVELENKANSLLRGVLAGVSFAEICLNVETE